MILASQSPRRIELKREAGYDIRVINADIDETPFDGEAPLTLVERLARAKAAAGAAERVRRTDDDRQTDLTGEINRILNRVSNLGGNDRLAALLHGVHEHLTVI